MPSSTHSKKSHIWWYIGLFGALISAPNTTIIKYVTETLDPFVFIATRFAFLALIGLIYVWFVRHTFTRSGMRYTLISTLYMTVAVMTYVWAVNQSTASYLSILTLLNPIILVMMSRWLTGEKINSRVLSGVTLGLLGAFIIVAVPIALSQQSDVHFYPFATLLAAANVISYPLAIIYAKKATNTGVPVMGVLGISSTGVFIVAAVCSIGSLGVVSEVISEPSIWLSMLYSAIVVALVNRAISIKCYDKLGAGPSASLTYIHTFIAILIPLIVLGEKLSIATVLGGILILVGALIVERKAFGHTKYHHIFRHHQ